MQCRSRAAIHRWSIFLARPRKFNEVEVLDAAVECFWRHGFKASSMRDLSEATGINQPSLYNAFGDKRSLFEAALERYAARAMRERLARLEASCAPKDAIRAFFRELIVRALSDPDRRGCMIVNAAIEVAPHEPALRAVIAFYLEEIHGFFLRCLKRAAEAGELSPDPVPKDLARLFLGLLLGVRVAARATPNRGLLEGMIRPAMALLDNSPSPRGPRPRA
jgi:TetR/AcrR family transcriptional regulator, transcriptional repressor for nem operon